MGWPGAAGLIGSATNLFSDCGHQLAHLLLSAGSAYSLAAIACTLAIAGLFTLSRRKRRRPVPMKVMFRALFPRRLYRSPSGRADLVFAIFNIFIAGVIFGGAIMSSAAIAGGARQALTSMFGVHPAPHLPQLFASAVATAALYLAYELSYWVDHYLSHKIPALWEFHKVHHSAESLSPLTNFRVHPVDTIVFYNITALLMGLTAGTLDYAFGRDVPVLTLGGHNILLLGTAILLLHLQHTHLWISFSGRLGRVVLSPAHHQIHHSANPLHFGKNLGASLAIFDRLFGTLHVPAPEREKLSFGVPELDYNPHTARTGLLTPFMELGARMMASRGRSRARNRNGTASLST